jgi:hypothetical protein
MIVFKIKKNADFLRIYSWRIFSATKPPLTGGRSPYAITFGIKQKYHGDRGDVGMYHNAFTISQVFEPEPDYCLIAATPVRLVAGFGYHTN